MRRLRTIRDGGTGQSRSGLGLTQPGSGRPRRTLSAKTGSCAPSGLTQFRTGFVPRARNQVIVHHADCLRESVDDYRAAEFESARLQLFGELLAHIGLRWDVAHAPDPVHALTAADMLPDKLGEPAGLLFHDVEPPARTADRSVD